MNTTPLLRPAAPPAAAPRPRPPGSYRARDGTDGTVAYLINQYPQPSHTFIRREIAALEAAGLSVARFTLRATEGGLADPDDEAERGRTRVLLSVGAAGLVGTIARTAAFAPHPFLRALRQAVRLGRRSARGIRVHLIYLAEACVLKGWLKGCDARRVHVHFGTNATTVALLCRTLGGPPFSFTVHGPEEFDSPRALGLNEKIGAADFVVAVSEYGRSQLYRWAEAADWPKIQVVHCGVDAGFFPAEPTPVPDCRRLVSVGRLVEQKGQLVLLRAAAILRDRGIPFELVLVGDGPLRAEIERAILAADLGGSVRLTGVLGGEAVRREILAARAFVLPSFAEGLPVAIMEALALGRPVISTYIAGIPELVEPGTCGWLVPPGSVEALADAMSAALSTSPAELTRMGRLGASRVADHHNATAEAAKLAGYLAGVGARP